MTVAEKMGIDLSTPKGLEEAMTIECMGINDDIAEYARHGTCIFGDSKRCTECISERLLSGTKKRFQTMNEQELREAAVYVTKMVHGNLVAKSLDIERFVDYLCEDVCEEVEE